MNEPTITIQPATQYVVRADFMGMRTWAVYTLSEHGGTFTIQSDYGDFAHWWPERGDQFLELMTEIDEDYFLRKLVKERKHFNYKETLNQWKLQLLERRRSCGCTEDTARNAWDALVETNKYRSDRDDLLNWMIHEGPHTELFEEVLGWDSMVEGTYMEFTVGQKNLYHMFQTMVVPKIMEELASRRAVSA